MMPDADTGDARGKLVAFRNDRLGARLLTLVNAMRLSADHGIDWACYWPFATDVTAVFNDATELFEADFVAQHFIGKKAWVTVRKEAVRIGDAQRENAAWLKREAGKGRAIAVDQAFGVNVLADEDPAAIQRAFVETLGTVPFSAALRPLIHALAQTLQGATAYHIRRGDLTEGLAAKNKPWPHKMVPNEFYDLHMEQALGAGGSAILFSDDAWTLDHYRKTHPALKTITDVVDVTGLTEAQRDFIELYAMSRCAKIIAPERSAFSSTAVHMGAAKKLDVTEDVTDAMSETAHERLITRLRDHPRSFPNDGEIGQSLAHVGPYLAERGRYHEAGDLSAQLIHGGLNIAFTYADTMRYQHRAGDVDGAVAVGRLLRERHVFHLRYFAEAEFQHGYALLRSGDQTAGLRHLVTAFWHGPTSGEARLVMPTLVQLGVLDAQNFLPVNPLHLSLHRRRGPLKALEADYPELVQLSGAGMPDAIGGLETAVWDWGLLLRSVSMPAALRSGIVDDARKNLEGLVASDHDAVEMAGLAVMLEAYSGDADAAARSLTNLAAENPNHAMTWQRLSHALYRGRHFPQAAEAAVAAANCAPDVPAMRAWAGLMSLRTRDWEPAIAHLGTAAKSDIGLPSIHALYSQALAGADRPQDALAEIDRARYLAPMEAEFALHRSTVLERLGRVDEAITTLMDMVDRHRAPGKLFRRLVGLMASAGDRAGAAQVIAICQQRYPEHPATARLVAEHAA